MTKLILTASILSLLTAPAFAAEEGFFSKLEQGIKAEANTQLQGAVGASIKGTLPPSAQRAVKPAANDLVKGAVDASASSIKQNNTQKAEAQYVPQEKGPEKPLEEPSKAVSSSAVVATLDGGKDELFIIPKPKVAPLARRLCRVWAGNDCMADDRPSVERNYPEIRKRVAAQAGITQVRAEAEAWKVVYDQYTGKVDFSKANEQQMQRITYSVQRTNELVEKGLIHPDTLTFRECMKSGLPYRTKPVANSKADVCS